MVAQPRQSITRFSANCRQSPVNDGDDPVAYEFAGDSQPATHFRRSSPSLFCQIHKPTSEVYMDQAQLIQAAASIAGGMAAAHYDRFSGLVASRITEIAETAVRIAKAIEIEARKLP
jgi:hypothetical protein